MRKNIDIIAQNFNIYEGDGKDPYARTGEVSLYYLYQAGARGVIIGHSEVNDSPEIINKKLLEVIKFQKKFKNFSHLIILIGETYEDFKNHNYKQISNIVYHKCQKIFHKIRPEDVKKFKLIVGYEPQWGTHGSGKDQEPPPAPELISLCIDKIKIFFQSKYKKELKPQFIYGGRSTPERTEAILKDQNINGLILGSACNTLDKTTKIIHSMSISMSQKPKILVCNFKAYEITDSYQKYLNKFKIIKDNFIFYLVPTFTDIRLAHHSLKKI